MRGASTKDATRTRTRTLGQRASSTSALSRALPGAAGAPPPPRRPPSGSASADRPRQNPAGAAGALRAHRFSVHRQQSPRAGVTTPRKSGVFRIFFFNFYAYTSRKRRRKRDKASRQERHHHAWSEGKLQRVREGGQARRARRGLGKHTSGSPDAARPAARGRYERHLPPHLRRRRAGF